MKTANSVLMAKAGASGEHDRPDHCGFDSRHSSRAFVWYNDSWGIYGRFYNGVTMALWKKKTREDMLAWFASLDDKMLEAVWKEARDDHFPETSEENFICRGCRHWVPGIDCEAPVSMGIKSYRDCEKAVTENPISWLSRMKDPFIEEGREAFRSGNSKDECPYDEGTDGQNGWQIGWDEESALDVDMP